MAAMEKESWRESESGTTMTQARYEELAKAGKFLSEDEAKERISQFFGFIKEAITIIHEASTYEVNNVGRMRKKETFIRPPRYEATDWNYIRFNVKGWMYEMVNGELRFYEC